MREVSIQVVTIPVTANARRLKDRRRVSRHGKRKFVWRQKWKMGPAKDIVMVHSPGLLEELEKMYSDAINS